MSIAKRAQEVAQEAARAQREVNAQARVDRIRHLEDYVRSVTGLPAIHERTIDVAHAEPSSDRFSRGYIVAHEKWEKVSVDDVVLLAKTEAGSTAKSPSWRLTLGYEDPVHGWYRSDYDYLYLRPGPLGRGSEPYPEDELVEKFVDALARAQRPKHPAVVLAEKGAACPTCHRGWDA